MPTLAPMRLCRSIARATAVSICSEVKLAATRRNEAARGELIKKGGRIPFRLRLVSAAFATTLLLSNVCVEGADVAPASQPLADVLEAFAKSTGYQLVYRADLTAGLTSTAAPPDTPPLEALRQLLRGTDLEFSILNSRTIVISRSMASAGRSNSSSSSAAAAHRPDTMAKADAAGEANPDTADGRDQDRKSVV